MKQGWLLSFWVTFIILGSSCTGVKYLQNDEKLLYKQNIEGVEKANKDELDSRISLNPNLRVPFFGAVGAMVYETGKNNYDSVEILSQKQSFLDRIDAKILKKESKSKSTRNLNAKRERKLNRFEKRLRQGNLRMRTGTPLARYDSTAIANSAQRMTNYLKSRGFREAEVDIEKTEKKKKVTQKFVIHEGPQSYIDSLVVLTGDTVLTNLIKAHQEEALIQKGDPYNEDLLIKERERLELLLKNNGYYTFNKQFIAYEIQYAPQQEGLWVKMIVNKPAERDFHKSYHLDSIIVNTNGNIDVQLNQAYEGVSYNFGNTFYSAKVLDSRLKMNPHEVYAIDDVINTQKQLLNMDMFRFVNINFDTTIIEDQFVANIYTAPLQKFQLTQEVGLNVTEGGVPGPFYNVSLKNRNTFQGSEIMELNGFAGIEDVAAATDQNSLFRSLQYGANLSLTFPRFMLPFNARPLNRRAFNAKSRLSLGYSFTNRPEYIRSILNGSFGYTWQNTAGTKTFKLNLSEVNLIDTDRISDAFADQLSNLAQQGNTLALAFLPSFVSSTSFSTTLNNNYGSKVSPSNYLSLFGESGGLIQNFIGTGLLENNELEFYKFVKFQVDFRRNIPISDERSVVFRANFGYALPYGENDALPYEKFFFAGGSNSNRAWNPRRLGPGSSFPYLLNENGENVLDENGDLVPNRTGRQSFRFEQPGEILLEINLEWRDNVTGFLDYAFFIDAGNVWRIKEFNAPEDAEVVRVSEGGKFEIDNFYRQIAIGAGFGLRFDFDFLVFRLDLGHKVKDPRFPEGQRWLMPFTRRGQTVWNIGVGYPF